MEEKATLLVVEDDVHLLQGIRDILEIEGYQVWTAASGLDGLDVLGKMDVPPDLIISDIMMPRMDGYQFFEAVRATDKWVEIPFIFLTAKGEKQDVRRGWRLGADEYIVKPMDPEDLLVIVAARLERRMVLRDRYTGQISEVKRNILTILNHEFRTPLTYMVAYSDMLNSDAESLTSEELRTFLRGVNSGADRFRRLVENFIALVELETGEASQNFEARHQQISDVRPVLMEVIDSTRLFAEEQGVELVLDAPAVVPPFAGDHEYLRGALNQLVENAIKFSDKPDAQVELRVTSDAENVYLIVQDHGRGISPEEYDRIWDPFYQIDRSVYEDQGAGSGLAIVQGLVRLHGGSIKLDSTPKVGSTFTIVLPRVASAGTANTVA